MQQRLLQRTLARNLAWITLLAATALMIGDSEPVAADRRFPYAYDNQAVGKESYMVRLTDGLPPASNGNDGDLSTIVRTTERTVDGYWEVDLEQEYAVYHVEVNAADGFGERMTHATARLFNEAHDSVFSQKLDELQPPTFYVDSGGPRRARYVRVGFEHKERSSPTGDIEWYLGIAEVMVIGRPASEVGLLSFEASTNRVEAGGAVTLTWQTEDASEVILYPEIGSVSDLTDSNGVGSITLAPSQSTEYVLLVEGTFGRDIDAATITVDEGTLPVRINELVARNRLSLEDGYQDSSDWIELHNPGHTAIDLTGYGLSDDPADPTKWVFPQITIPAHGYLIVFASGNEETIDPEGGIHTNWRLNGDGESVLLTAPDGVTVADAVLEYPPQCEDLAYGRDIEGNLTFQEPTPGAINLATSYEGWLPPLVFSHERGFCDTPFELSIEHEEPDVKIRYALDGGEPWIEYHNAIPVTGTQLVRASVTRKGCKSPRVQTHTYLFLDDVIASDVMNSSVAQNSRYTTQLRDGLRDLPTIALSAPALPDDYREHEASVELLWPDGADPVQADCGVVRYGGAWTTFAKKSYRLKFRKDYGTPKFAAPLFNGFDHGFPVVETFDELELAGGSHDMNQRGFYMAGRFAEDAMLDMGSLNPHGRFVHLYFNGTYWGQYHLRERLVEHFLADYLGGEPEDYLNVRGNDNVGSSFVPGTPDPVNRRAWTRVRELAGSYQQVRSYLDINGLIDFMLLWFYGNCESEYRASGPAEAGSGLKFWMADADGFLRTSALNQDRTSNTGPAGLLGALVAEGDPDFMVLLADRIYQHMVHNGALTPERNTTRLLDRMAEIQDSLVAECARWGYRTPANWNAAAAEIVDDLFPTRTSRLMTYLRNRQLYPAFDPPQYNQRGGNIDDGFELVLSTGSGTIYYTLDGNDPRLPGGGIAPSAYTHGSPSSGEILVAAGSVWRYWDRDTALAGIWHATGFDDSTWPTGPAQLGYGDGDEASVISYGSDSANKHITYYFRHSFEAGDPAGIDQIVVYLMRDDGAVLYLNGTEVLRDNMPTGDVTAETTAESGVGGADESDWLAFEMAPEQLIAGTNTLAVEVHQVSGTSSDLSFDLILEAHRVQDHSPILLHGNTVVKSRVLNGTQWSALNEAHFVMAE
jgi:Lamin Tail Domain/CotH kinase protein/Fn3 associated